MNAINYAEMFSKSLLSLLTACIFQDQMYGNQVELLKSQPSILSFMVTQSRKFKSIGSSKETTYFRPAGKWPAPKMFCVHPSDFPGFHLYLDSVPASACNLQ